MGAVHVCASPQSAFFRLNCVGNHSSHGCALRRVKAGYQEKRRHGMLSNWTEALEIAVSDHAGDLLSQKTERAQFRINRCFITTKDRTAPGRIAGIGRGSGPDLERHTADKSDEMDRQRLHPFGSIGRFMDLPPLPLVENFP